MWFLCGTKTSLVIGEATVTIPDSRVCYLAVIAIILSDMNS